MEKAPQTQAMLSQSVSEGGWLYDAWHGFVTLTPFPQLEFGATILGFLITGGSAIAALIVARNVGKKINLASNISDIAKVQSIIEEIRRYLRSGLWYVLPERFTELRHLLVAVRNGGDNFSDEQNQGLDSAINSARALEDVITKNWKTGLNEKQVISADAALRDHADKMNALSIQTRRKVK